MKHILLFLVLVSTSALAARPPPISPQLAVPGFSQGKWNDVLTNAMEVMRKAMHKQGLKPEKMTREELQCAAAKMTRVTAQALVLFEQLATMKLESTMSPSELARMQDGVAYLQRLEDDWCNGQGGNTATVQRFIEKFRADNAPQAKSLFQRFNNAMKELEKKPSWSAADWALVVAVILAAAAADLITIPA